MKARYKAVVDRYAQAIPCGQLPAGSRLPTHRTLAAGERLSLATATRVYRELEEMGYRGETGRGTFVRDLSLPSGARGRSAGGRRRCGSPLQPPSPSRSRATALREALRQLAMAGDIDRICAISLMQGRLAERDIIARHLTCQHFAPDAENVLIVNAAARAGGDRHGAVTSGDVVAVDAPGPRPGLQSSGGAVSSGAGGDPRRPEGPDLRRFIRCASSGGCGGTMPTLHNPLG